MTFTRLPLRRSALCGVGASAVNYALSFALVVLTDPAVGTVPVGKPDGETIALGDAVAAVADPVVAGWLVYDAVFVPLTVPVIDPAVGPTLASVGLLSTAGGPLVVLRLAVPATLVGAGWLAAATTDTPGANGDRNAGAAVAVGVLPLAVLGTFLVTAPATAVEGTAAPAGIRAIVVGIGYPIAFGGLGGWLAGR